MQRSPAKSLREPEPFRANAAEQLASGANVQNERLVTLTQSNEQRLEAGARDGRTAPGTVAHDNAQKLEQMRNDGDEKLHATLEQRLGESFKLVSTASSRCTRAWVKCRRWRPASATSSAC